MYEYFIHTTFGKPLYNILKSGFIDDSYSNKSDVDDGMEPGIYCFYMWDGLPQIYKDMDWTYGRNYIVVMDKNISKTNEMYVCNSVQHGSCVTNHKKDQIKINSKTLNFKPLQTHIMTQINAELNRTIRKRYISVYTQSHEVVFKGKIPISHIKAILIHKKYIDDNNTKKIIKYIKDNHLSIKIIPFTPYTQNFQKYFQMI